MKVFKKILVSLAVLVIIVCFGALFAVMKNVGEIRIILPNPQDNPLAMDKYCELEEMAKQTIIKREEAKALIEPLKKIWSDHATHFADWNEKDRLQYSKLRAIAIESIIKYNTMAYDFYERAENSGLPTSYCKSDQKNGSLPKRFEPLPLP